MAAAASVQVVSAERGGPGPAVHRGERRDGGMVSCHLTEPNYKTTQRCAHGWGARPPVAGGKIDDVGVTCGVETHPDIITLLSAHVEEGGHRPRQSHAHICPCVTALRPKLQMCVCKTPVQTTPTCRSRPCEGSLQAVDE